MKSPCHPFSLLPRLLAWSALALMAFLPVSALAAPSHVQASLVAATASIQPGKPFTVALRFVHDPHWHTYWTNPGTGLATSLTWTLPAGITAGEIQWPAPSVLKDHSGTVIGNGYEGELFLPVTLVAPADLKPGTTVTLAAAAEWLMCEEVCMPGAAKLSLTLPVSADAPTPDAEWGAKVAATVAGLPRAEAGWSVAATREAKTVTLTVKPATAGTHLPADLHFFADDNLVAYELPQTIAADGQGGFVLTLPVSAEAPADAKKLAGVLTAENGWMTDGSLRGLRIDTPLTSAGSTSGSAPSAKKIPAATPINLPATLALAFIGGLILNLMPCVFPVLGIKILGFVKQSGNERGKVVAHGLVFALGVLLSFWTLAGVLAVLHQGGAKLGWGFQLQSPAFVFSLAIVMLVFALNMSGVFEFGLAATGVGSNLQSKAGLAGSFFTGVLATVVATPCSAPFLAPALGAAVTVPPVQSFLLFTAIAVGLAMPYLLLSIFPQAVKLLPRPGPWMETFKQFMSFPLYATVGYLVWVLAGQLTETGTGQLMAIGGLVLVALGTWFYGRWNAPGASPGRARFGLIAGLALVALGAWTGWPKAEMPGEIAWEKWSPERVAQLRADGRTVYVDFTARWCFTCQTNKAVVFHSTEVLKYFKDQKIATLRGDWTNHDPQITAELASYQRSAVPFNLIWKPGQPDPVLLPELLTPSVVLDALKK